MADSKLNNSESASPFDLWSTAYTFLTESIKTWAYSLFEFIVDKNEILSFITEFVYLVVNLVTSGILIFKSNNKFVITLAGVGFFNNFYVTFKKLFSLFPQFSPKQAMSEFYISVIAYKEQVQEKIYPNDSECQNDWLEHVKFILTAFFTSIVGGLGYILGGFKGIGNAFRTLTSAKIGVENIKNLVDKSVSDLVLGKIDPVEPERQAILQLVEQGQQYSRMSLGDIASSNKNRKGLRDFIKEVNQSLAHYKSHDTANLRSMLVGLVKELNKKLEEIDHLLPSRQVTTGVFIHGAKGVGKSSLVAHLCAQLAATFDYQPKIYTVSSGVRFYEPYLNEDFGVVNEFGSVTKEESFVFDANRICSSDPFNFESASLGGKIGSCQLKALFVTSNSFNPSVAELQPHAIPAFWDRFIIIEARDDKIKNRRQICSHRKPDFSHLKFDVKEVLGGDELPLAFNILFKDINVIDLLSILECKIAMEAIKYNDLLKIELPHNLKCKLHSLSKPADGSYPYKYFGFESIETPNNSGRNFCILRIQGIEGTGKTSTARNIAKKWVALTRTLEGTDMFVIQESANLKTFSPLNKPAIYILDDWVTLAMSHDQQHEYVEKMNTTHNNSLFILTTNEVIRKARIYNQFLSRVWSAATWMEHEYPYNMDQYPIAYGGFYRRIGLDYHYLVESQIRKVNSTEYNVFINVENNGTYKYKKSCIGELTMLEKLKDAYLAMQNDRFDLKIFNEKPLEEDNEVDMELVAESADILFSRLSNVIGTSRLYLQPTDSASLRISERIKKGVTSLGRAVKPADFICDEVFSEEIPARERYITIVKRMVRVLLQYYDKPSFRIILKDTGEVIYCKDSIVYYYSDKVSAYVITSDKTARVLINAPVEISAETFARMLCAKDPVERFKDSKLTLEEYVAVDKYYRRCLSLNEPNAFVIAVASHENYIRKTNEATYAKAYQEARNNKLLLIGISGIIGVSSLSALYGLYKLVSHLFSDEEPSNICTNAFANVGSTPPKRTEQSQNVNNGSKLGTNIIKANSPYEKHRSKAIHTNSEYTKKKSNLYIRANGTTTAHEHICRVCLCLYSHKHDFDLNSPHPQWNKQCPNEECSDYHGNTSNTAHAVLIEKEFSAYNGDPKTPYGLIKLLGEPFSPVANDLIREIAKMSKRTQHNLYDKLWQCNKNDVEPIAILEQYEPLSAIVKNLVIANMLSEEDMIECDETELELIHRKLQKAYVRLNVQHRSAYAIHVGKGFFLSVSHCFDKVGDGATLSSNSVRYPSVCVALLRNRDISVIYCLSLANLPSARKYFVLDAQDLDRNGYFLRCGPGFQVISGSIEYKAYQERLEGKSDIGERYSPTTEVLKIRRVGMECAKVIKRGDCGFPFLCKVKGAMRIIGFHNAYKIETVVFGAFISQPLIAELCEITVPNSIDSVCSVVSIPVVKNNQITSLRVSMPHEYLNSIDHAIKPDPFFPGAATNSMISIGYNPMFKNWGGLKEKHVTHDLELINKNLTLPAAYNMHYVEDTSELVVDGQGRVSPLWSQACKYRIMEQRWDEDIMNHAIELCLDYNKLTYATKPFRILTEFEAINGTREPFLSNVDITTSAGPYARYFYKTFTKREIFDVSFRDEQPLYTFNNSEVAQNLKSHLKEQTKLLEQEFISPCLISQDNAKVENISAEKAKKGKVRLFNNVDPNVNAILKKYFGDWFAHVMEKHQTGYYAVGQDPYITSTEIWHAFSSKEGKILNTDFSAFDKLLIPRLIQAFCYIGSRLTRKKTTHTQEQHNKIYKALADTLTHAVHILNGSIYIVNNGNESGTFVTTLMNCVSVDIIFIYSFIKCWNKVPAYRGIKLSLKDIMSRSERRILGDDKTQKVTFDIPMDESDLIEIAEELGMKCTPAKGDYHEEELIDFCSRVLYFDEKDQVVYPRLKKESINGLLYWFASFSVNQVRDNLMIALFEASFYDEAYYNDVLSDAMIVANEMGVDIRTVPFTNYELSRRRLQSFVMNDVECQKISALTDRNTNENSEESVNLSQLLKYHILSDNNNIQRISSDDLIESQAKYGVVSKKRKSPATRAQESSSYEDEMDTCAINNNSISRCHEFISKLREQNPREIFDRRGEDHCPVYTCTIIFKDREFIGEGPSKANAKTQAYGALEHYLKDNVIPNARNTKYICEAEQALQETALRGWALYIESHIETAKKAAEDKRFVTLVANRYTGEGVANINGFHCFYSDGSRYVLSPIVQSLGKKKAAACYMRYPGIRKDPVTREITLDVCENPTSWSLRKGDAKTYSDDEDLIIANSRFTHLTYNNAISKDMRKKKECPYHNHAKDFDENVGHWYNFMDERNGNHLSYLEQPRESIIYDPRRHRREGDRASGLIKTKTIHKLNPNDIIYPNSGEEKPLTGVMNNDNPMAIASSAILASDNEVVHPTIMNRSAPSNSWLHAGGIVHNIFDQIYNQYIWSTQFQVESTQARGKIIMQVPYTPVNNEYANSYIQNALLLHGRFSGDWIVQFTCAGSASGMQGSLIFSWQPQKITTDTVGMDQLTKYSYFTNSIATPWTQNIIMRDARMNGFYREVPRNSKKTDLDVNQPHIVIAVESPGVSTFKDVNKVYISVASKLCSEKDQMFNPGIKPFIMADPQNTLQYDSTKGYTLNF